MGAITPALDLTELIFTVQGHLCYVPPGGGTELEQWLGLTELTSTMRYVRAAR
jgi:hypothetical protein